MTFELDYNKILFATKKKLRERKVFMVEADEIINEAYIKLIESGEQYYFGSFMKLLNVSLFGAKSTYESTDKSGQTAPRRRYKGGDHKTCKDCKEVFPIEAFRDITFKNANNIIIKKPYCRKCENKRSKISQKKRDLAMNDTFIINTILKRKNNTYSREFIISRPRLIEIERNILSYKRNRRKTAA